MSVVRANVLANLASTAVVGAAAVLSAPFLFKSFGAEAYAFVGLYMLAQAFMPLLDLGVVPALSRAMAWHRGRGEFGEVSSLISAARWWVLAISVFAFFVAWIAAGWLAESFAGPRGEDGVDPEVLIVLMAAALCARMSASLERAALMANEQQVSASAIQGIAAVARTFGAFWVAVALGWGVLGFFALQIPIAVLEWLAYRSRIEIPPGDRSESRSMRNQHLKFGANVTLLAVVWLAGSQIDRIVLASSMSLADYGGYSLASHLAVATLLVTGAINAAFLPAMTAMAARGEKVSLAHAYGTAAVLVIGLATTWTVVLALGGAALMPNLRSATTVDPVALGTVLSVGNVAVSLLALTYVLQSAHGVLRLHSIGTVIMCGIQIVVVGFAATGGDGWHVAITYASLNWCFVLVWLPLVHAKFLAEPQWAWGRKHLAPPIAASLCVAVFASLLQPIMPKETIPALLSLAAIGAASLLIVLMSAPAGRRVLAWVQ